MKLNFNGSQFYKKILNFGYFKKLWNHAFTGQNIQHVISPTYEKLKETNPGKLD